MNDKFGVITVSLIVLLILSVFWLNRFEGNLIEKPRIVSADRVNRAYIRKVGGDYVIYSDGNIEPIDGFRLGRLGTSSVEIYKEVIIINKAYIEKLFERRRR